MVEELKKIKKCYGCGVILQSEDENEVGWVPHKHLESEDTFLCKRCFTTHHYGADKLKEPIVSLDFRNALFECAFADGVPFGIKED